MRLSVSVWLFLSVCIFMSFYIQLLVVSFSVLETLPSNKTLNVWCLVVTPQGYGFQPSYDGEDLSCTVKNLHRSTNYKFRVSASSGVTSE